MAHVFMNIRTVMYDVHVCMYHVCTHVCMNVNAYARTYTYIRV